MRPDDDVREWLGAAGVEPAGPIETVHARPWSTVLRVPTADADLYLKQEAPLQAYEVPLTVALAGRWPDRVPEVVAADTERAWLLLRDAGTNVADSGKVEAFPEALRLYGELQVGEVEHVEELMGFGLRDLSLSVVADAYETFFERDHGLEREEVARLLALAPKYRALCEDLAALGLPTSIQHDDLHQWNVFVRDTRVAICDWGDSSVGFPLWSWLKPLGAALQYAVDPRPLRDAYLTAWAEAAPARDVDRALDLAVATGLFAYVLQIRRQYDATQAHEEYQAYLPQNLRRLLEHLDAA